MKLFAGLVPWMLPVAAFATFMLGWIWYGSLSKTWMAAAGLTEEKIKAGGGRPISPLVITFVAQLVMAWMLAGLILHLARGGFPATMRNGAMIGAFIWLGFVATTLAVNYRFQMRPWSLTLIDGGYWLGVLLIQGALLGAWGLA